MDLSPGSDDLNASISTNHSEMRESLMSLPNLSFEESMRTNPRLRDTYKALAQEDDIESDGEQDVNYFSEAIDAVETTAPQGQGSPVSVDSSSSVQCNSQADSLARRPH